MFPYRFWFAAGLLAIAFSARADHVATDAVPDAIPGVTTLTAEALILLAEREPGLVVVDSRVSADRHHGFIQGSVSLPDRQTSCATLGDVLPRVDTPAAFYCNGVKCGRSVTALKVAKRCGYTKLHWFRGGFEEWKQKGFPFLTK